MTRYLYAYEDSRDTSKYIEEMTKQLTGYRYRMIMIEFLQKLGLRAEFVRSKILWR